MAPFYFWYVKTVELNAYQLRKLKLALKHNINFDCSSNALYKNKTINELATCLSVLLTDISLRKNHLHTHNRGIQRCLHIGNGKNQMIRQFSTRLQPFINVGLIELSTVSVDNSVYETLRTSAPPVLQGATTISSIKKLFFIY